MRYAQG